MKVPNTPPPQRLMAVVLMAAESGLSRRIRPAGTPSLPKLCRSVKKRRPTPTNPSTKPSQCPGRRRSLCRNECPETAIISGNTAHRTLVTPDGRTVSVQ